MTDHYKNLGELLNKENSKNYNIETIDKKSKLVVIAPHGGGIEPGTSQIARKISGNKHSLLIFEGLLPKNNKKLHVTSTNIEYKPWHTILKNAEYSISIHGTNDPRLNDKNVEIGGLNDKLIKLIYNKLEKWDFSPICGVNNRSGKHKKNIVNLPKEKGCQLELGEKLRRKFFNGSLKNRTLRTKFFEENSCDNTFYDFINAIKEGIL